MAIGGWNLGSWARRSEESKLRETERRRDRRAVLAEKGLPSRTPARSYNTREIPDVWEWLREVDRLRRAGKRVYGGYPRITVEVVV